MAQINTPKELFKHFRFTEDCKMQISQLHNTHREYFLRPFIGICVGINKQVREIIENEREYPEGTFYVKTDKMKVIYIKKTLEITSVSWIEKK